MKPYNTHIPKQTANKFGYTLAIVTIAEISLQNVKTDLHWLCDMKLCAKHLNM